MPRALIGQTPAPNGYTWNILQNGFSPKAKVVFLAACGINSSFIAQWHLQASGQALIVPVYASSNPDNTIDLVSAAADLQFMLQQLGSWNNVGQAVDLTNASNGASKKYTWTVIPQAGRNVTFTTPSN